MTAELNDDQLQRILTEVLAEADPLPAWLMQAAKEAYVWRTIDAELAELVFDSQKDMLVGVRGEEAARQITFRSPGVEIEVMLLAEGERRLVGQLIPPQVATVELRHGDTVREGATDHLGRFSFSDVPVGPIQLAIATPDGGQVVTDWMVA